MIRALYTAVSGMMVESRKLDLSAQNLYQGQTPGYKATRVLRQSQPATEPGLPTDIQALRSGEFVDASPGTLRVTGKDLDLALDGDGFFSVQTPGGTAYTRDGRFRVDADRVVKTFAGHPLLGEGGPIQYPAASGQDAAVEVAEDGTVSVDGQEVGRLALRSFPGYRGLQAAGGSLFYPTGAVAEGPADARVVQRSLEGSNTSSVQEMTRTLETVRAFESYQKVVQTVMDEVTAEAVRMGRVA